MPNPHGLKGCLRTCLSAVKLIELRFLRVCIVCNPNNDRDLSEKDKEYKQLER